MLRSESPDAASAAAAETDLYGRCALHWMCASRVVPLDALCELIAACRAAATIADLGGLLPLQCSAPPVRQHWQRAAAVLSRRSTRCSRRAARRRWSQTPRADRYLRAAYHHALALRSLDRGARRAERAQLAEGAAVHCSAPGARRVLLAKGLQCLDASPPALLGGRAGVIVRALPHAASRAPYRVLDLES